MTKSKSISQSVNAFFSNNKHNRKAASDNRASEISLATFKKDEITISIDEIVDIKERHAPIITYCVSLWSSKSIRSDVKLADLRIARKTIEEVKILFDIIKQDIKKNLIKYPYQLRQNYLSMNNDYYDNKVNSLTNNNSVNAYDAYIKQCKKDKERLKDNRSKLSYSNEDLTSSNSANNFYHVNDRISNYIEHPMLAS
jgi:hypothetical protein